MLGFCDLSCDRCPADPGAAAASNSDFGGLASPVSSSPGLRPQPARGAWRQPPLQMVSIPPGSGPAPTARDATTWGGLDEPEPEPAPEPEPERSRLAAAITGTTMLPLEWLMRATPPQPEAQASGWAAAGRPAVAASGWPSYFTELAAESGVVLGVADAPLANQIDWDLLFYRAGRLLEAANAVGPKSVRCDASLDALLGERSPLARAQAGCGGPAAAGPPAWGAAALPQDTHLVETGGLGGRAQPSWMCQPVEDRAGEPGLACPSPECEPLRGAYRGLIVLELGLPSAASCCDACTHANPGAVPPAGHGCDMWSFCAEPGGCGVGVPYGTCQLKVAADDPRLGIPWFYSPLEPFTSGVARAAL